MSILHLGNLNGTDPAQIDLESSEDDILEIQQEISVLSTCASPFVTQYIASFLRGHKLWIVMEYLGGGSCLDLVGSTSCLLWRILTFPVKTWSLQRSPHCDHMPRTPTGTRIPTPRGQDTQRYQSCQCPVIHGWQGQTGRFWCRCTTYKHKVPTKHVCRHALLDGSRGNSTKWL